MTDNKYHVKNIVIALKNKQELSAFRPLVKKLEDVGIVVHIWESGKGVVFEEQQIFMCAEKALYITDCVKIALMIKARNLPLLGYQAEDSEGLAEVEYIMERPEEADVQYLDRVYRRFHDIPWNILETERCLIRETVAEDVDSFFEIYSNPEIVRYTEALYADKKQERNYIREYIDKVYRYFEFGIWTVIWKETGEIIGRAGLTVREGYELPELGFVIAVPWQGKGVAYEICSAILQYAKEEFEFERVQALVMPENTASLALCYKLGFEERGNVIEKETEYIWLIKEL